MPNKFWHVKRDTVPAKDCAWPGCKTLIPKSHHMCERHWPMLPKPLRDQLWALYEIGQEDAPELVSEAYQEAAEAAQSWIATYEAAFS